MNAEWKAELWFRPRVLKPKRPNKDKNKEVNPHQRRRKPLYMETLIWKDCNGNTNGKVGLPVGGLATKFLRIDCQDEQQVRGFLRDLGSPPIFDIDGNMVKEFDKVQNILINEKEAVTNAVELLLAVNPIQGQRTPLYDLKPSQRVYYWRHKRRFPQAESRLEKIGEKPSTITKSVKAVARTFELVNSLRNLDESITKLKDRLSEADQLCDKRLNTLLDELENKEIELVKTEAIAWAPVTRYVSRDPLSLIWKEIYYAAENDYTAVECKSCHSYAFSKRNDKKYCHLCGPPSRRPIANRAAEEQALVRENDRARKKLNKKN